MALSREDIDRMAADCRNTLNLKTKEAERGHDWVVDSHSLSSHKLLQLLALARLGLPVWERLDRAGLPTEKRDRMQLGLEAPPREMREDATLPLRFMQHRADYLHSRNTIVIEFTNRVDTEVASEAIQRLFATWPKEPASS